MTFINPILLSDDLNAGPRHDAVGVINPILEE